MVKEEGRAPIYRTEKGSGKVFRENKGSRDPKRKNAQKGGRHSFAPGRALSSRSSLERPTKEEGDWGPGGERRGERPPVLRGKEICRSSLSEEGGKNRPQGFHRIGEKDHLMNPGRDKSAAALRT